MRRWLALLAFVLFAFASSPVCAQTTLTLHFGRPELSVRAGAVQAVSNTYGGLAPYAEAQVLTRLGHTSFGLAVHGGASYEQHGDSYRICGIVPPCFDDAFDVRYLDFTSGLRLGFFPKGSPIEVFAGAASHAVHRQYESGSGDRSGWLWTPTVQAGADARISLAPRFRAGVGVIGFLPIGEVAQGMNLPVDSSFPEMDMSRYGVHLSVQYDL